MREITYDLEANSVINLIALPSDPRIVSGYDNSDKPPRKRLKTDRSPSDSQPDLITLWDLQFSLKLSRQSVLLPFVGLSYTNFGVYQKRNLGKRSPFEIFVGEREPSSIPFSTIGDISSKSLIRALDCLSRLTSTSFANKVSQCYGEARLSQTLYIEANGIRLAFKAIVSPLLTPSPAGLQLANDLAFRQLMDLQYPEEEVDQASIASFYAAVQPPPRTEVGFEHLLLKTPLMSYQRNAVAWMIQRERGAAQQPSLWNSYVDEADEIVYIQKELALIATSEHAIHESNVKIHGGLLCEEMGLGKTLEMIATILGNPRPDCDGARQIDTFTGDSVRPVKTTLIIAPSIILQQWLDEIAKHSSISVHHYRGIANHKQELLDFSSYQVVVTSYDVLASEVHYAAPLRTDRTLRKPPVYSKRISPLTSHQFWRVVIDEAQMIQNGVSSAAQVACLIPRVYAWIVTGTPISKNCTDLFGLLHFLRFPPFFRNAPLWSKLLNSPTAANCVANIFSPISCRNTKERVAAEMSLPPQTHVLCEVQLTTLEDQHLADLIADAFQDIDLDAHGEPRSGAWEDWQYRRLQSWLEQLRQASTHPQIGGRNKSYFGSGSTGSLQPLEVVLERMLNATRAELESDRHNYANARLLEGQILEYAKQTRAALRVWLEVLPVLEASVVAAKATCTEHDTPPHTEGTTEKVTSEQGNNLRHWRETLHRCLFFLGTIYFQLEDPENEKMYYAQAKDLRQILLSESEIDVAREMLALQRLKDEQDFATIPELFYIDLSGGFRTRLVLEQSQSLIEVLNNQANQLDEWRELCIAKLLINLADKEEDPTGEEYQQSLDAQAEAFSYHELVRFAVNDRAEMVTGVQSELLNNDLQKALASDNTDPAGQILSKGLAVRNSMKPDQRLGSLFLIRSQLRQIIRTMEAELEIEDRRALALELSIARSALQNVEKQYAAQREAVDGLQKEVDMFSNVYNARLEYYRQFQVLSDGVREFTVLKKAQEESIASRLDVELNKALGRTVKKWELEESDITEEERTVRIEERLRKLQIEKERLKKAIDHGTTRSRYLEYLGQDKTTESTVCTICTSTIAIGAFTICGHIFCRDCFAEWFKQHRACPICKTVLQSSKAFYTITLKQKEVAKTLPDTDGKVESRPEQQKNLEKIYTFLSREARAEIDRIPLRKSYSSKIDAVVRHLLHLPRGTKSVVYSFYADCVAVIHQALTENGVRSTNLTGPSRSGRGRRPGSLDAFMEDPTCEVLLLSGKSRSAGLTLVNATNMFLVEPLLSGTIESQVVSRLHRIGQTKPTTVYQFAVSGLETSILERSAARKVQARAPSVEREDGSRVSDAALGDAPQTTETPSAEEAVALFRQNFQSYRDSTDLLLGGAATTEDTLVGRI